MTYYNLFLDDFRHPYDCSFYMSRPAIYTKLDWVIVRSAKEFVDTITKKLKIGEFPELVSFDHDLADEHYDPSMHKGVSTYNQMAVRFTEPTGKECAEWLVQVCIDNDLKLPECEYHTMNPAGKERLKQAIADYERLTSRI